MARPTTTASDDRAALERWIDARAKAVFTAAGLASAIEALYPALPVPDSETVAAVEDLATRLAALAAGLPDNPHDG